MSFDRRTDLKYKIDGAKHWFWWLIGITPDTMRRRHLPNIMIFSNYDFSPVNGVAEAPGMPEVAVEWQLVPEHKRDAAKILHLLGREIGHSDFGQLKSLVTVDDPFPHDFARNGHQTGMTHIHGDSRQECGRCQLPRVRQGQSLGRQQLGGLNRQSEQSNLQRRRPWPAPRRARQVIAGISHTTLNRPPYADPGRRLQPLPLSADAIIPPMRWQNHSLAELLTLCAQLKCLHRPGYLSHSALQPSKSTAPYLSHALIQDAGLTAGGHPLAERVAETPQQRNRDDFSAFGLVIVDGWILSLIDARLRPLAAVSGARRKKAGSMPKDKQRKRLTPLPIRRPPSPTATTAKRYPIARSHTGQTIRMNQFGGSI